MDEQYGQTPCRKCTTVLKYADNFCHNCGSQNDKRCSCGAKVNPKYKFCPNCGVAIAVAVPELLAEVSSAKRPETREGYLAAVKERLRNLKQKRTGENRQEPAMKKTKKDLILHVGLKYTDSRSSFTLVHRKFGGGIKKIQVERSSSYNSCISAICSTFGLKQKEEMYLIDNTNTQTRRDNFTLSNYVKEYCYVGATRMYLVVQYVAASPECRSDYVPSESPSPCESEEQAKSPPPPVLTPHKIDCVDTRDTSGASVTSGAPVTCISGVSNTSSTSVTSSVSMLDVEKYLLADVLQGESQNPEYTLNIDNHPKGEVPVSTKNAAVAYFMDLKRNEGLQCNKIQIDCGEFVLFSDSVFEEFLQFRSQVIVEELAIINPPLCFFMEMKHKKINHLSENVAVLEEAVVNEYEAWCMEI